MKARTIRWMVGALGLALTMGPMAWAWGPVAQRAIASSAAQIVTRQESSAFKTRDVSYEMDMINGALDGPEALDTPIPIATVDQAVNSIGAEIQLLRKVSESGMGAYYAYRLGVLARLVSDTLLPYGLDPDAKGGDLRRQIFEDVDKDIKNMRSYKPTPKKLQFVWSPTDYFANKRRMFANARQIILGDYTSGVGFGGYLKNGTPVLFEGATEAVADVWYTILFDDSDVIGKPSAHAVTWYYVDEINYALNTKRNFRDAERALKEFLRTNTGESLAYERVGDHFYEFGSGAGIDRGVEYWMQALDVATGAERTRLTRKLASHYMNKGQTAFAMAGDPEAPENVLEIALGAFTRALEYDRGSDAAADSITKTQVAIAERNERLDFAIRTVASGDNIRGEADQQVASQQYESAIANYQKAIAVYDVVDEEFKKQFEAAQTGMTTSERAISDIYNKVLSAAETLLSEADLMVEEDKFDEAIKSYQRIPPSLDIVPDGAGSQSQHKAELVQEAQEKAEEAETAKMQAARSRGEGGNAGGAGAAGGGAGAAGGGADAAGSGAASNPPARGGGNRRDRE